MYYIWKYLYISIFILFIYMYIVYILICIQSMYIIFIYLNIYIYIYIYICIYIYLSVISVKQLLSIVLSHILPLLITLFIEESSHKRYVTLTSLIWSFEISIWSKLRWRAVKVGKSYYLQIDGKFVKCKVCIFFVCEFFAIFSYLEAFFWS